MPELVPFSRRFHWDLLLRILQLSDTPTLAVLGAVSFDLLVASSPLLYRDVTVKSMVSLQSLFCERKEKKTSTPSRIIPLLSLSQLRTLHVDSSSQILDTLHPLPNVRIDYLPLPLDLLRLSFSSDLVVGLPELYSWLFPKVNPLRVKYDAGQTISDVALGPRFHLPRLEGRPLLYTWTRIETLVFRNIVLFQFTTTGFHLGFHLGFLPPPSDNNQRRVVRVHLDAVIPPLWIQKFDLFIQTTGQEWMKEAIIVLVTKTEKVKKEVEAVIQGIETESARKSFAVVVEG